MASSTSSSSVVEGIVVTSSSANVTTGIHTAIFVKKRSNAKTRVYAWIQIDLSVSTVNVNASHGGVVDNRSVVNCSLSLARERETLLTASC